MKTVTLASAAAILALSSMAVATSSIAKDEKVHCFGVNSCKGQSDCKSGNHDCKGMNSCKGQGFKAMTAAACDKAGGSQTPK
jgi:uncharacterized membrane protein